MDRWIFIGITADDEKIRIDNPDIPIICDESGARKVAVDLALKYEKQPGFSVWIRNVICECISDAEKSLVY